MKWQPWQHGYVAIITSTFKGHMSDFVTNYNYVRNTKISVSIIKCFNRGWLSRITQYNLPVECNNFNLESDQLEPLSHFFGVLIGRTLNDYNILVRNISLNVHLLALVFFNWYTYFCVSYIIVISDRIRHIPFNVTTLLSSYHTLMS